MLGQQYFDIRSDLRDSARALIQLAEETSINQGLATQLHNVLAVLKDPFQVLVIGEADTGKSTLINAIVGEDLCPMGEKHPASRRIACYQHGKEKHDLKATNSLAEHFRPLPFLEDFSIVDIPGDGSVKHHQEELIREFIPTSDFILVVFPVTDPWSPTTWKLLELIHEKWQDQIVLILQQCDRRSDEEIDAILEHLHRTSINRCQKNFPTFAVSGKKALLAKTSGLDKERLLEESRIAELEEHISREINRNPRRLEKIEEGCSLAKDLLKKIREKLHTPAEVIRADDELFSTLEDRAEKQQMRTTGNFEPVFAAFDNAFMSARLKTDPLLDDRMGIISSLKPAGDLPQEIERIISSSTLENVKRSCEEAAFVAEADIQQLWDELSRDMQNEFKLKLSVGSSGEPDWTASRKRLVQHVEDASSGELKNPYLCDGLKKLFRRRRRRMIGFLGLGVLCLGLGGWLSWKGLNPYQHIAFGAVAFSLLASAFAGFKGTSRIRAFFAEELDAQRRRLHEVLLQAFNQGLDECYQDFIHLFDPMREVCTKQREEYKPLIEAAEEMENAFRQLEDKLRKLERKPQEAKK